MDPLSITASTIAILGLADSIAKTIKSLVHASKELEPILSDVCELKTVIESVRGVFQRLKKDPQRWEVRCSSIVTHLNGAERLLQECNELVQGVVVLEQHSNAVLRIRKKAWISKRPALERLPTRIRGIREKIREDMTIATLDLGILTQTYMDEIQISLRQFAAYQIHGHGSPSVSSAAETRPKEAFANNLVSQNNISDQYVSSDMMLCPRAKSEKTFGPLPSSQTEIGLKLTRTRGFLCGNLCRCACHQKRTYRTSQALEWLTECLFLERNKAPQLSLKCNIDTCQGGNVSNVSITYFFPAWIFRQRVTLLIQSVSQPTPEFLLKTLKVIDLMDGMFQAARNNDTEYLRAFLASGLRSPYEVTEDGWNAFSIAVIGGNVEAVKLLSEFNFDVSILDDYGRSAADHAWDLILSRRCPQLRDLFPGEENVDGREFSTLQKIILGLHGGILDDHISFCTKEEIDGTDTWGRTALTWATILGQVDVIEKLIKFGADPAIPDKSKMGPLNYAVICNHCDAVRLLLSKGAPTALSSKRISAFFSYCSRLDRRCVKCLKALTVLPDLSMNEFDGPKLMMTPFQLACQRLPKITIHYLLDKGGDVDKPTKDGYTPLMLAVIAHRADILDILLFHGASIEIPRRHSGSLLHVVISTGNAAILRTLAKYAMPISLLQMVDRFDDTPAKKAVKTAHHMNRWDNILKVGTGKIDKWTQAWDDLAANLLPDNMVNGFGPPDDVEETVQNIEYLTMDFPATTTSILLPSNGTAPHGAVKGSKIAFDHLKKLPGPPLTVLHLLIGLISILWGTWMMWRYAHSRDRSQDIPLETMPIT